VAGAAGGEVQQVRREYRARLAELGREFARLLADPEQADRLLAWLRAD
jgi:hypothetical protein